MKSLKKILALVLALVLALSVVACGKPADTPVVDEPATNDTPSTETEEVKEEEPYTITISVAAGTGVQEGWDAVAAGYEALHPNCDVIVDLKPGEGYGDWARTVAADYQAEGVPDILTINEIPGEYRDEGEVINWNEYMEDVNPYDPQGRIWKECFNYEAQSKSATDNSFDCLNLITVQVVWFYNIDMFEECGVEAPKTWDDLVAVCEALYAKGYQPISVEGDYDSFYAMRMGWLCRNYIDQTNRSDLLIFRSQPGDYTYDPDKDDKWEINYEDPYNDYGDYVTRNPVRQWAAIYDGTMSANTPGHKAMWDNFLKVFPKYAGGDAFYGCTDCMPAFYQGKAGMILNTGGFAVSFANDQKKLAAGGTIGEGEDAIEGAKQFRLGSFPMPSMTNESGKWGADEIFQSPARSIEVSNGFTGAFNKNAEQVKHVVDFMMYYSSSVGHSLFLEAAFAAGWVPAGNTLVYDCDYPDDVEAALSSMEFIGNGQNAIFARGLSDNPESTRAFYDLAIQLCKGEITSQQYVEKMAEQHMKYFNECLPASIAISDFANPANEPVGQDG
ncbi:MAG: extracellular solute-binding protein [Oscillospiraceae bacterium]|nr:extracellular solute-binding protein [Oscillospiraceae bacterium]